MPSRTKPSPHASASVAAQPPSTYVDRTRDGQRTRGCVTTATLNPKHAALLDHDVKRQAIRNRERRDMERERNERNKNQARKQSTTMHSVSFNFVFGTDRHGNQITSETVGVGPESGAVPPHENIALAYTVSFPKKEPFRLSLLEDEVHKVHRDNKRRIERMTNPNKAAALRFVSGMVTESVQSWLECIDEDTLRFHVDSVLESRCYQVLDLKLEEDHVGHVRLQPNLIPDTIPSVG